MLSASIKIPVSIYTNKHSGKTFLLPQHVYGSYFNMSHFTIIISSLYMFSSTLGEEAFDRDLSSS